LRLFNTGRLAEREGVEKIGQEINEDIVGGTAGALIKSGDQMSIRAQNLTKRGVVEKVLEAIPRATIQDYIRSGRLLDLEAHPVISYTTKLLGLSGKALVQEIANTVSDKTTR
jgi:hypothetical protein